MISHKWQEIRDAEEIEIAREIVEIKIDKNYLNFLDPKLVGPPPRVEIGIVKTKPFNPSLKQSLNFGKHAHNFMIKAHIDLL